MTRYVALLRGINVGGKNLIKMPALKACFEANGFENVSTYIQTGNVVFEAADRPSVQLTRRIEAMLAEAFDYVPTVVVRNRKQMRAIVERAPKGFGAEPTKYRYDVFFLKEPLTATAAMKHLPTNPAVDRAHAGTSGTCLVHRRPDWPCGSCDCPAGLLATHPARWARKLDSCARDPLLGRHCSGGNASPEFHLSGRTSRPKLSAVHRGEWPFQRSLELDLAEGTDCNPGLDDRNRFTAAQACLPSGSSRRYRLAVRIQLAPSRYRSSWGTSLVELRPVG